MISVDIKVLQSGEIAGFDISGHSGYDEIGKDIVCASVSSVAYMVANTLTDVMNINADIFVNEIGQMKLKINDNNLDQCRILLEGFKIHMILLEDQYPKNIKVNYVEV